MRIFRGTKPSGGGMHNALPPCVDRNLVARVALIEEWSNALVDLVCAEYGELPWEKDFCCHLNGRKHHSDSFFAVSVAKIAICSLEVGPRLPKPGVAKHFQSRCPVDLKLRIDKGMNDALRVDPISKVFFLEDPIDSGYLLFGNMRLVHIRKHQEYRSNGIQHISDINFIEKI